MENDLQYHEILTSKKTIRLFLILSGVFFVLFLWRYLTTGVDFLTILFLSLFVFFLFYVINYRRLEICVTKDMLRLIFGLFNWRVRFDNIAGYKLDKISRFAYYGGAGIHFMWVKGRYRASFNFLEYPRVVVTFKNRIGPIRDLSFSTRNPDTLLSKLDQGIKKLEQSDIQGNRPYLKD
jgi:hypothetical protein